MYRLPLFDATRPPPLASPQQICDPTSDAHFVATFLDAREHLKDSKKPRTDKPTTASIGELKTTLAHIVTELERLKTEKASLEKEINTLTTAEWQTTSERLLQIQLQVEKKLQQISDSNVYGRLKQKIHARRKKRAWLKRRNDRLRQQKQQRLKDREKLHERIAVWQQEQRKLFDEERQAQQQMECASYFLADVHRRKAACKRHLAKFEKMRQHSSCARREDEEKRFSAGLEELTKTWTAKLADCIKEEKRIKDVLARRSARNFQRRVENEWNRTLFGDVVPKKFEHPLLVADRSRTAMIETRWAWDACLDAENSDDQSQASAIPLGWVLPPKDPMPEWAQYRIVAPS